MSFLRNGKEGRELWNYSLCKSVVFWRVTTCSLVACYRCSRWISSWTDTVSHPRKILKYPCKITQELSAYKRCSSELNRRLRENAQIWGVKIGTFLYDLRSSCRGYVVSSLLGSHAVQTGGNTTMCQDSLLPPSSWQLYFHDGDSRSYIIRYRSHIL
jgi:hypothetical protein